MDVVLGKKSRKVKLLSVILLCLCVFSVLFYIIPKVFVYTENHYEISTVNYCTITQSTKFEGRVEFKSKKAIQAKVAGLIEELSVQAGDTVKKGEKLLSLDTSLNLTELIELERELFQLQGEKEQLQIDLDHEILNFQNNLRIKEVALDSCRKQLERYNKLLENGAISIAEVEDLKAQIDNLSDEIQFLIASYSISWQGFSLKEKCLNEKIKNTNEDLEKWREKIRDKKIEAEDNGVILECIVKEGGSYIEGVLAFTEDKPLVMIGNMKFTAVAPLLIKNNVLSLVRGPYLADSTQKYVFRVSQDRKYAEKVPVTFGIYDETNIEIREGLEFGDEILISSYSRFKEQKRIKLR